MLQERVLKYSDSGQADLCSQRCYLNNCIHLWLCN